MAQYLIGMYQPDGIVPPPEFLAPIMARLGELTQEMQQANVWVFAGGLHDASTATVLHTKDDGAFRNTEILTMRNGRLVEAEVFFGWMIPHEAPEGGWL